MFRLLSSVTTAVIIAFAFNNVFAQGTIQMPPVYPSSGCASSSISYGLFASGTTLPSDLHASVTGSGNTISTSISGTSATANVTWKTSGNISFIGGGQTWSQHFSVTNEITNISVPESVCSGSSFSISATVAGSGSKFWFKSTDGVSWTSTSPSGISITAHTKFKLDYSVSGCSVNTAISDYVDVDPIPSFPYNASLTFGTIYQGQPFTVSASPSAAYADNGYEWTVQTSDGITRETVSSLGAVTTFVGGWSSSYTGNVNVSVRAKNDCGTSGAIVAAATVHLAPVVHVGVSNIESGTCDYDNTGISMDYVLISADGNETITNATVEFLSGSGGISDIGTNKWRVTWTSSGRLIFTYSIASISNQHMLSDQVTTIAGYVGDVSFSPSSQISQLTVCQGGEVSLHVIGQTGSPVSYWSCSGTCSGSDTGWTQLSTNIVDDITHTTSFRAHLDNSCGRYSDNVITVEVVDPPIDILVNGPAQVCNEKNDAKIVLDTSEPNVTYTLIKDSELTYKDTVGNGHMIWFKNNAGGDYEVQASNGFCKKKMPGIVHVLGVDRASVYIDASLPQPVSVCQGTTITLSAHNIKNPHWTSSQPGYTASGTSIIVSPTQSITYYVSGQEANCDNNDSDDFDVVTNPKPSISLNDVKIFSGQSFNIPTASIPSSIEVSANPHVVTGAISQTYVQTTGTSNPLAIQTLTTAADGYVTYTITPFVAGCRGLTRSVTVTVYKTPPIYSDRTDVYKGLVSTLTTDVYDSYQWIGPSGGTEATTSAYQTRISGVYRVSVTKNGAVGISGQLIIGGQLDTVNENYIITRVPLKELASDKNLESKSEYEVSESIQYFDDLGRAWQTVNTRMSPSHHDMVQPTAYDELGREAIRYLPYASEGDRGKIQKNAISTDQPAFYTNEELKIATDLNPFSETIFEKSPLNRVTEQGAPGVAWQPGTDHTIKKEYLFNGYQDVLLFNYDASADSLSLLDDDDAYYKPNTLFCEKTIDEAQNDVLQYVDKQGRTICKKVKVSDGFYACTYYVYDDTGNLLVVIPPEGLKHLLDQN